MGLKKEEKIDTFLLLFLVIVGAGSVFSYVYYLKEKGEELKIIRDGICPKCNQKTIFLSDKRGGGCGPKVVTFVCTNCKYENSFSIEEGCSI